MAQIINEKRIVPCSGIDTDARWGYSHTKKGWIIFGYKLHHMVSTTDSVVVPLSVNVTSTNITDNQAYDELTSTSLSSTTIKKIHYMVADPGYDDQHLYELSMYIGFQLACPVIDTKQFQKKDFNWLISMNPY